MSNILAPISEPYDTDIAAILAHYPRVDGYLLSLFRTFANSRRFLEKGVPNLLDTDSPLPLRAREIVILRITANLNCEYEWGVHVSTFAKAAKLSDKQIAATRDRSVDTALWSTKDANLIQAIDELCTRGSLQDMTRTRFQNNWTAEQQLEIFALCGTYHTVSFVANVARLHNEPFAAQFAPE